jgi:hypothetical protein
MDSRTSTRYNLRGRAKKERLALSFSEALTRAARLKDEKEAFELIGGSTFKVDPESVQTINA